MKQEVTGVSKDADNTFNAKVKKSVVSILSVMMGSMLAYVLNRFDFPGNNLIRNAFMIATLIPGIAMQVTTYQIMSSMGLVNSLVGYIILMSGTDVIQYFENLDTALYSFSGPYKSAFNIICAGVLITLLPALIIFIVFQKQVYAGLASGSVKG